MKRILGFRHWPRVTPSTVNQIVMKNAVARYQSSVVRQGTTEASTGRYTSASVSTNQPAQASNAESVGVLKDNMPPKVANTVTRRRKLKEFEKEAEEGESGGIRPGSLDSTMLQNATVEAIGDIPLAEGQVLSNLYNTSSVYDRTLNIQKSEMQAIRKKEELQDRKNLDTINEVNRRANSEYIGSEDSSRLNVGTDANVLLEEYPSDPNIPLHGVPRSSVTPHSGRNS